MKGVSHDDHFVHLHGATWRDYERLLEMRGDHSAPRYTYLEGELEIMSPSKTHESIVDELIPTRSPLEPTPRLRRSRPVDTADVVSG